jgi:hypothetical protein
MRILIHILMKRSRQSKLRKKWGNDRIKIGIGFNNYKLMNTLKTEDFIISETELLQDLFSTKIHHIYKKKKWFKDDIYILSLKNFSTIKNYKFKLKKDTIFLGLDYKNNPIYCEFIDGQSVIIFGRSGSGKTLSLITIAQYVEAMERKFRKRKIIRVICDPKGDDFNGMVGENDYFFRLDTKESYEELSKVLETAIQEAKEYNQKGELSPNAYHFIFDELIMAFHKDLLKNKEYGEVVKKIVNQVETLAIAICRKQIWPLLSATQSFSVNDSSIPIKRFSNRISSRPNQKVYADVLGSKKILNKSLRRGRFVLLDHEDEITVQFPLSIKQKRRLTKKREKNELKRPSFLNPLSRSIEATKKGLEEKATLALKRANKTSYKRFMKAHYQKFYENYQLSENSRQRELLKNYNYQDKYDLNFLVEREFQTKAILRYLFVKRVGIEYKNKGREIILKI